VPQCNFWYTPNGRPSGWALTFIVVLTGLQPNTDNFLIVTDYGLRNIYQVDVTTGATAQLLLLDTASAPRALTYDSTAKLLYWSDVDTHTINVYSLLTNRNTVIFRDDYIKQGKCWRTLST